MLLIQCMPKGGANVAIIASVTGSNINFSPCSLKIKERDSQSLTWQVILRDIWSSLIDPLLCLQLLLLRHFISFIILISLVFLFLTQFCNPFLLYLISVVYKMILRPLWLVKRISSYSYNSCSFYGCCCSYCCCRCHYFCCADVQ